ncbi:MAG: amino acid permease, partial [Gemmataceae bacterium]
PYSGLMALVWLLGGGLTLLGALIYAEVCVVLPQAGGNYVFLRESYGRLFGWMWGWVDFWMIRSGSLAALAIAFTSALQEIYMTRGNAPLNEWGQRGLTVGVLVLLGVVNMRGVRLGGGLQLVLTLLKVGTILGLALLPLLVWCWPAISPEGRLPSTENLVPLWPETWSMGIASGIASALLSVLWPYHGWMNIAPIAGEVRDPGRTLPWALLCGVGVVVVLYLACNGAYYLTLPGWVLAQSPTPATQVAQHLLGATGTLFVSFVILCSTFGSLNGNILVGPRLLFAMGADSLAPRWLHAVHPRWQTPAPAIAVLVGWSVLLVLGVGLFASGKQPFDQLTDFAMFGAVIFETMAVLAIFRLRRTMPDAPRPYRCPGYPWLPALYVLLPVVILANRLSRWESAIEAAVGLSFLGLGVLTYYALGLHRPRPSLSLTREHT